MTTEVGVVYALAPARGRVSKSRQVPIVYIDSKPIDSGDKFLGDVIEESFHKYHNHDVYAGVVDLSGGLFGTVELFCASTDKKIATIIITREYANGR